MRHDYESGACKRCGVRALDTCLCRGSPSCMRQVSEINGHEVGWDGRRLCGVAFGLFCGDQLFSSCRMHGRAF